MNSNIPSEKKFGLFFGIIFLLVFLYFGFTNNKFYSFLIVISFIFIFCAFFYNRILILPNKLWFKFGLLLNKIVSPIVMGFIFFLFFLPTGLIMKFIFKKDLLNRKMLPNIKSYWIKRKEQMQSIDNQF
tara:strand:- start:465 stop:851 length:387 start_codon:yes stop_codon:yes gene_type:complete